MRGGMVDRRRVGVKRRKSVCTEGWGVESRNNLVTSWYTSSRTWREVEDDRVSNEKLLVARGYKRYRKICRRMWYVLKDKE